MTLNELLKADADFTVSIGIKDLRVWHKEVIEDTRRKLEAIVTSDKAESYLTVAQAKEMLNVNASTLWRWNKRGYLIPIELGGGRRYKMSDIKNLMNGGQKQSNGSKF